MKPANDNFLGADVASALAEIHGLLADYPEIADDPDLKADMLEGSTTAFDVLTRLVDIEREADSHARAAAARISDLGARKQRAERRKEAMRAFMLRIMQSAGIQKAPLVEATISVTKGRESVEIVDEAALPDALVRIERVPDKTLIKEALATGVVAGARIKMGEPTLSVRVA